MTTSKRKPKPKPEKVEQPPVVVHDRDPLGDHNDHPPADQIVTVGK